MHEYITVTEQMIFTSLMKSPEFETKKAFEKNYLKAMMLRSDEFYKKYGVTLEFIEGFFRVEGPPE